MAEDRPVILPTMPSDERDRSYTLRRAKRTNKDVDDPDSAELLSPAEAYRASLPKFIEDDGDA